MTEYLYALGLGILILGISFFVEKRMGISENSPIETKTNKPNKDEIIKDE